MIKPILCIGEALIDMICTDTGIPLSEGEHYLRKAGGAPTNVAAAIAALGGAVDLAAKVGGDPFGRHINELLTSFGVNTKWLIRDPETFTTFAFVSLMQNGERDFYFNRGADRMLDIRDMAGLNIADYSIIHFGSATAFLPGPLQQTYLQVLQECLRHQVFISFDPNYRHLLYKDRKNEFIKQSWQFLKSCHFFKLSDEEAILLTGTENVQGAANMLLSHTKAVFAITLGKDGTLLCREGNSVQIPSIPVHSVDTTGAGDAFVGALLYQLQQHDTDMPGLDDWRRFVSNANRAGARTCEFMGAMEAFRHLDKSILA